MLRRVGIGWVTSRNTDAFRFVLNVIKNSVKLNTRVWLCVMFAPTIALPRAFAGDLDGTAWKLVKIMSMDDRVDVPNDPDRYTLAFGEDGRAALQADCNRGTGSWTSSPPNAVTFGPIAATRAMCPPGSLSETYLAQFEWVRTYTLKDQHLFLATMADGSILEFAPLPPVAATVLGETIRTDDAAKMQQAVLTRLFNHYAAEKGIQVSDAELDRYVETMRRQMAAEGLTAEDDLTPEEAAEADTLRREMARTLIRQWMINRSLYETYGGRISYQQLGPEPLDAYRQFLESCRQEGSFTIDNPEMSDAFWRYFTEDSMHQFMAQGGEDEAGAFQAPPWEKD